MTYNLTFEDIRRLMYGAADAAVTAYRVERGDEPTFVSERKAAAMFGWGNVRKWMREGKILGHRAISNARKINLNVAELKALANAEEIALLYNAIPKYGT